MIIIYKPTSAPCMYLNSNDSIAFIAKWRLIVILQYGIFAFLMFAITIVYFNIYNWKMNNMEHSSKIMGKH